MLAADELKKSTSVGMRDTGAPGMIAPPPTPPAVVQARALASSPNPMAKVAELNAARAPAPAPLDTGASLAAAGGMLAPVDSAMRSVVPAVKNAASTALDGFQTGMGMAMAGAPQAPAPAPAAPAVAPEDKALVAKASAGFNSVFKPGDFDKPAAQATPYPKLDPAGPTVINSAGEPYTAEKGWNPVSALVGFAQDTAAAARGDAPYDTLRANREAARTSYGMPASEPAAPAKQAAAATPAPAAAPPTAGMLPPVGGLYDFMPGLGSQQAGTDTVAGQTGLRTTTVGNGVTLGGEKINPNQKLITNVAGDDAARAGLAANAGMVQPSGAGNPNLGTAADNLRQLHNIQSLSSSTPTGGAAVMPDSTEADNAEKTARWRMDDMLSAANRDGTRTGKQVKMAMAQAMMADQTKGNLGMLQNQTAQRGQDIQANTAVAGHQVQARGQDLQAAAAADQIGLGMRKLDIGTQEGAADRENRLAVARLHADVEGKKLTSAEKLAAAKQQPKWAALPAMPNVLYNEHAAYPQLFDVTKQAEKK